MKLFIVSPPRTGSSVISQLLESAGYTYPEVLKAESKISISASEYNSSGYNEDVSFTLLNDQLIRIIYGSHYSFLHSPSISAIASASNKYLSHHIFESYFYDLDESTVVVPINYMSRLKEIANHSWDVWGLSRMTRAAKWYKAYSKHKLAYGQDIYNQLLNIKRLLIDDAVPDKSYIKDPRLIFSLPAYYNELKQSSFGVILINRNPEKLFKSMTSHYGHRLFSEDCIDNHGFVSNHFNYQIRPQSFSDYLASAEYSMKSTKELGIPILEISYDKLMNKNSKAEELDKLDNFIMAAVDRSLLYEPLV